MTPNTCLKCGFDMGSGFVNCGMSEDGTCPECHTVKPEQNRFASSAEHLQHLFPCSGNNEQENISDMI